MCDTCGCDGLENGIKFHKPGEENDHDLNHDHVHEHNGIKHIHHHTSSKEQNHAHKHSHDHSHQKEIQIGQSVMQKNNMIAERNRGYFEAKNIFTLNLVSSPGSGKTNLLERTIKDLSGEQKIFVIEGDQQTMNDAKRIQATGAPVIQINTGNGCHLDGEMINKAVKELNVSEHSILFIENVGNLVCPALFDLGESKRVVIISVTEGEDKPLKYPNMFMTSDVCIINKIDLLAHLDFDLAKLKEYALQVNHHLQFFELSAKTGEGMKQWYEWLAKF